MIDRFKEEYSFLSNFYKAPIVYKGISYQNNEAAFQAQKCIDESEKEQFSLINNPVIAKRMGRKVKLRSDWESVKVDIMLDIVRCKFDSHPELKKKLLETGDEILVEGNNWNDTFWGVSLKTGKGRNVLGNILMKQREAYKEEGNKEV